MGHTWPAFAEEEIWDFFMQISGNPININEEKFSTVLVKTIDILGRETQKKGFNIEIYDDGSVQKKYIINK